MTVWHPDADRLTLVALPAEPGDDGVDAHLAVCEVCREHVDAMRRTVELARQDAADTDISPPPPRVWQAIVDELDAEVRPARTDVEILGVTRARPRWTLAVPVAACIVGLAAGLGIGIGAGMSPGSGTPVAQLAPLGPAGGSGSVRAVEARGGDRQLVVRLDGVDDTADADFLEAWLMDSSGTRLVALGSLARDGSTFRGEFTVPSDLPMGEYDTVDISAERWDGDPSHSRVSLLRGPLT